MTTTERGHAAEAAVADYLRQQGMIILDTNVRVGHFEIDIVARNQRVIAIVEVRTRSAGAWTTGFGSIDAAKRLRVRRAGERLWRRRFRSDASVDRMRFDAASVLFRDGRPTVEYVRAAF